MNQGTIVISGGTKGIGRAIAERFAAEGFHVGVCARTEGDLEEMASYFAKNFPKVKMYTFVADARVPAQMEAFAKYILGKTPQIDILVNNAGVFLPGMISEETPGSLETMVETNLYSAYYLTRAFLSSMKEAQKGHIINMCSIASEIAYPNGGSYSISKFALLGFSKVLREEMKPFGIRVTSVMPGATWSASWEGVDLPQERLMQSEDVAKAVWCAWELSPQAVMEELVLRPQLGDL